MQAADSRWLISDKEHLKSSNISADAKMATSPQDTSQGQSLGSTTPYFRVLDPVLRERAFMVDHWGRAPVTDYSFALPAADTATLKNSGLSSPTACHSAFYTTQQRSSFASSIPAGIDRVSSVQMGSPPAHNSPGSPSSWGRDVTEKKLLEAPTANNLRRSIMSKSSLKAEDARPTRASRRIAQLAEAHELAVFEARVVNGSVSQGKVTEATKVEWDDLVLRTGESGSVSDITRRLMDNGDLDVLTSLHHAFDRVGCYSLAEQVMRRRLEVCQGESTSNNAENTLQTLHFIGLALQHQELHTQAESFLADAFAGYSASLAPHHADTFSVRVHLGVHFRKVSRLYEAREMLSSAYDEATEALGSDHPVTLAALREYVILLLDMSCSEEAEALISKIVEKHERTLGADHPDTIAAASVSISFIANHEEAKKACRDLVATATLVLGSLHPKVLQLQRQSALACRNSPEAVQIMEQLIVNWSETVGKAHRRVYHASHDAGVSCAIGDDFVKAESHFRSAYDGFRFLDGPNDYFTVLCCSKYSSTLYRLMKFDDCEQMMRKVQASVLARVGNNHVDTHKALNNVAIVSEKRYQWKETEQLFRDASAGWTRCAGQDEAKIVESMIGIQNLAYFLQLSIMKFPEATKLFRRCLQVWERSLGEEHPNTLLALNNVGVVLRDQRRMQECEPILLKVLKLREKVLGPDDPDTLEAYHNMAVCAKISRRIDDATDYHQHAWDNRVRILGDKHMDTIFTVYHVGLLHLANDMYYDGIDLFEECAADAEEILGSCNPFTLNVYNALANAFTCIGKDVTAEKYFCKALSGLEKIYGSTHPDSLRLVRNMATMYKRLKQFDVSEGYWRRALDGWVEIQGPDHPETLWTACQLALVLEIQFKDDQAAKYYKWAKAGREKLAQTDMSTLDPQCFDVLTDVEKLTRDRDLSDPLITNPYLLCIVQIVAKYFTSHVYRFIDHVREMIRKKKLFWPTTGPRDDSSNDSYDQDDSGFDDAENTNEASDLL